MLNTKAGFTETDYIDGLRTGNERVLNDLYKKHYNVVLKFVVSNSGNSDNAKDVYQDTIIILIEKCKDPEFKLTCQLQTFIYSIARNLWLKQLKKNKYELQLIDTAGEKFISTEEEVNFHELKEENIQNALQSLSELGEPCSTLIKDFYITKLSMDEIAEKFGYTNSDNAKTQKYKCLQRLKRLFFKHYTLVE